MVNRYFTLLEFIDINDDGIADVVLSPACNRRFRALLKCGVESASRRGRVAVGRLSVIRWINFYQASLCSLHRNQSDYRNEDGEEEEGSFIEQLQKRRHLAAKETKYDLLHVILATSNVVERFFSVARTTFGKNGTSSPDHPGDDSLFEMK
ncbi:hypothetical protein GQ600_22650 [Phytophthora cactorum]|nr:hypothetical protein GQ600_22650 [Phytophthora cactorum]